MSTIVCTALTYRPVTSNLGKPSTSDVAVVSAIGACTVVSPVPASAAQVWPASGSAPADTTVRVRCFGSAAFVAVGAGTPDPTQSPRELVDQVSNGDFLNIFVPRGGVIRAIAATIA